MRPGLKAREGADAGYHVACAARASMRPGLKAREGIMSEYKVIVDGMLQ